MRPLRRLHHHLPDRCHRRPYTVDARRCISYLTIELEGAIPEEFRPLLGNRIYGCDDCQLICPWNRFSQLTDEDDFSPRAALHAPQLIDLFNWTEENSCASPKARQYAASATCAGCAISPWRWAMRPTRTALCSRCARLGQDAMLDEHIHWALAQQLARREAQGIEVQTAQKNG